MFLLGKMFSMSEMEKIAEIVNRYPQLTVIADEVSFIVLSHSSGFNIFLIKSKNNLISLFVYFVLLPFKVYEHIVFDKENSPHISFASLPGMYDRTLTLNSSGKTFSATGKFFFKSFHMFSFI